MLVYHPERLVQLQLLQVPAKPFQFLYVMMQLPNTITQFLVERTRVTYRFP
jgi:hypothetical protein